MKPTKLLSVVPAQEPTAPHCKIAFVGDFPDDYARLKGHPFAGGQGKVFDQLLRTAGLPDRSHFLITNVFDQKPEQGDIGKWCAPIAEAKTWSGYGMLDKLGRFGYLRPEHIHHLNRLGTELQKWKPNLIIPLGATALWALTGVSDISIARGAVDVATLLGLKTKILPTNHPKNILQDWRLFHMTVADLTKAAYECEFLEQRLVKREIHIRPSVSDLRIWQKNLLQANTLSVDIETTKQQITCIGFAPSPSKAFVVPFADYEKPSRSYWETVAAEQEAWNMVRILCESQIQKVFQNGLYDTYYLIRQANIWPVNYCEDTRLQHHALYPELPKSLAFLGATYGNLGPWKQLRIKAREKRDD